jgi:hypothetical protein
VRIPEELVSFLCAVEEDEGLSRWLLGLERLSITQRSATLQALAADMRSEEEDPAVVSAIESLARPALYDAARQTLLELRGGEPAS